MTKKLPVTELAKMGYCETLLVLNKKNNNASEGYRDEPAINRGNKEHEAFDARVKRSHKPYATATDKRCFIATSVYGENAIQTQQLRQWRDQTLIPTRLGRGFVNTYYYLSPAVARILSRCPRLNDSLRFLLNLWVKRL